MDILIKHIQTEDSRLAKWVKEQQEKERNAPRMEGKTKTSPFISSFKAVGGEKAIDLRSAMDIEELQKILELFAAATGMVCGSGSLWKPDHKDERLYRFFQPVFQGPP